MNKGYNNNLNEDEPARHCSNDNNKVELDMVRSWITRELCGNE